MDDTSSNPLAGPPLAATAARISGLAEYINSLVGIPDEAGWFRLSALADPELLAAWHAEVSANVGDRRVAASYMSNWLISYMVGGALMPVLAERRLPLAGLDDVAVRRTSGGWFDALAVDDARIAVLPGDAESGHPLSVVLADEAALFDALADRVVELESIITALKMALPIGTPMLWGAVSDALSGQAMMLADLMGRDQQRLWDEAAALADRVQARQPRMKTRCRLFPIEHQDETKLFVVRGTCCLYYRTVEVPDRAGTGDGYCAGCPLRTDAGRRRRLVAWLNGEPAHA